MIKGNKKTNIFVTIFLLFLCATGIVACTDAEEPKKDVVREVVNEPAKKSAKEAEYELTDSWGADVPNIYFEDDAKMIFAGYFGLFVYSKETDAIVQSLDLKEIGCNMTQGDQYCEINVAADGNTVYLHVINEKKMYQYSVDTRELQHLDYKLPGELYDREKWEKTNKSGIQCKGPAIGDLEYWYEQGDSVKEKPLFQ